MIILRRIFGSFLSVATGWIIGSILMVPVFVTYRGQTDIWSMLNESWTVFFFIASGFARFVFPAWPLMFLPLYMLLPSAAPLWKWPAFTALGAFCSIVIISITYRIIGPVFPPHLIVISAAIIGGVTCLFASLTRHWFSPRNAVTPSNP